MERKRNKREEVRFIRNWWSLNYNHTFLQFDVFIVREMGYSFHTKRDLDRVRRPAFLEFRKRTGHYPFASLPTMRRWFGIGRFSSPSREQVYEICLQLGTGPKKAEEYLSVALEEVSFQFRDYREVFFMYGLNHKMGYQKCLNLAEQFESNWDFESLSEEKMSDQEFEEIFQKTRQLPVDKFLSWMLSCQNFFVGYRESVMKTLQECRSKVMFYIRKDAKDKLDSLLAETNYKKWLEERQYKNLETREIIRRFVKAHRKGHYKEVSQNMKDNILELSSIAYSPLEANSKLLAEVFSHTGRTFFSHIKGMSAKHLSDLFNVSLQRERSQTMNQVYRKLQGMDDKSDCPDWVKEIVGQCTRNPQEFDNVGAVKNWIESYNHEQRRRCLDVKRSDILPMIHYIAQRQYLDIMESKGEEYNEKKAKCTFTTLADRMLKSCHMSSINEDYELDAVLLSCFQPDEMYSFAEILDFAKKENE